MIFLVRSNSISGKAQLGHDVLSCSNVTGFSLLMFHLFRVLKCMFVSEFDLLFIFFVPSMPGVVLNELRSIPSFLYPVIICEYVQVFVP